MDQMLIDGHCSTLVSRLPDAQSLDYWKFVVTSIIQIQLVPLILNLPSSDGVPMVRQVVPARTHTSFVRTFAECIQARTHKPHNFIPVNPQGGRHTSHTPASLLQPTFDPCCLLQVKTKLLHLKERGAHGEAWRPGPFVWSSPPEEDVENA